MIVDCPACTGAMTFLKDRTPVNASGWKLEIYRCERCKVNASVDITYDVDEKPAVAVGVPE